MAVAVVVAGGESRRMGELGDKQFAILAGRPLLVHTLSAFECCDAVQRVVLVCGPEHMNRAEELVAEHGLTKVGSVVEGGAMRQQSVANGLLEVDDDAIVAIHDGARPLVTPELISRAVDALPGWDGVVLAMPATDTVKQVDGEGLVIETLDRTSIWLAQTPQVFEAHLLKEALGVAERQHAAATDDAALVERLGCRVVAIEGSAENIKITVPDDLDRAERILAMRSAT